MSLKANKSLPISVPILQNLIHLHYGYNSVYFAKG